jgi:hypothetical protein
VLPGGGFTFTIDPTQGPYDGSDDALIGIVNNSGATVTSLDLTSQTVDIFGFDGDGICAYGNSSRNPYRCTFVNAYPGGYRANGYEGPGTYFGNISNSNRSGTVYFIDGLADGQSTFFGLENTPAAIAGSNPGGGANTTVPEPSTVALVGAGTAALGLAGRRRQAARRS